MKLIVRHSGGPTYGGGWKETSDYEAVIYLGKWFAIGKGTYRLTAIRRSVGRLLHHALDDFERWCDRRIAR